MAWSLQPLMIQLACMVMQQDRDWVIRLEMSPIPGFANN